MMEKYEIQKLRDLPIEGVAQRLGLQVTRHKCLCPFHDDHHASLSFKVSKNTFRCFVCGASGGTIDLVMRHLNLGFREACKWLSIEHGTWNIEDYATKKDAAANHVQSSMFNVQSSMFNVQWYERFFERPWLNEAARRFLYDERRIDPRVVRWCRLTSWTDRQGVPWLQTPYYSQEGRLVGVQNRNLVHGGSPRFRFPAGSQCGIYNLPVLNMLRPGEDLYITEGCSDCWAMLSAGHKAIAIPSATLLSKKDVEQLSMFNVQCSIKYHMYPDRDEPGERLFLQLQQVLPSLVHHQLPPGCKDFSDYYLASQ